MKNNTKVKKIVVSGMLVGVAVALSGFSIPIGASRCFPAQHLINVIAGIFLGPAYGVGMAFCTSVIRNLLGTGSLLAFPGSMVGAFLCGYRNPGMNLMLSCSLMVYGKGSSSVFLCSAVFNEYGMRNNYCGCAYWNYGPFRGFFIPEAIIG